MQNPTYNLYPEIDISFKNTLIVDDLHEVYYEVCGNPNGVPVVFLHGGPGSGCNPVQRRFFDPSYYMIVLIDQRGCGRSKPQGSVIKNTTSNLVADIDAIRNELNIQQWLVFGGSIFSSKSSRGKREVRSPSSLFRCMVTISTHLIVYWNRCYWINAF